MTGNHEVHFFFFTWKPQFYTYFLKKSHQQGLLCHLFCLFVFKVFPLLLTYEKLLNFKVLSIESSVIGVSKLWPMGQISLFYKQSFTGTQPCSFICTLPVAAMVDWAVSRLWLYAFQKKCANTCCTHTQIIFFPIISTFSIYLKCGTGRLTEPMLIPQDFIVFPSKFSFAESILDGQHCFRPQGGFRGRDQMCAGQPGCLINYKLWLTWLRCSSFTMEGDSNILSEATVLP